MAVKYGKQAAKYFSRRHVEVPSAPIKHPAAWYGSEFGSNPPVNHFTDAEVAEMEEQALVLQQSGATLADVTEQSFPLPKTRARLRAAASEVASGQGFVVLRGLPVARWGDALTEIVCWGIGQHLGTPGAQNPQGEELGHVVDYGEEANHPTVRRYRTSGNIDFHCDGADIVGLLCLRAAKSGGQSRICSTVTVFNELLAAHPHLVQRLFEPIYLDRRDEEPPGEAPCTLLQPACFDGVSLKTFYHSEYFRSAERHKGYEPTPAQRELLDAYDAIAQRDDVHLDMWLQPGDLQLVSNHTVAHARTAYVDHDDPEKKRHLLRLWLSVDDE